ncbi:T9SS type A sorting domain-containing protein, partial [Chitinophagales bacterium]|nr:T9SS type A sorting domain-containing protein [Chitinophagales bacterium]
SFDVTYSVNGGASQMQSFSGLDIAAYEDYSFTHNVPATLGLSEDNVIEVTVSNVNGGVDPNMDNNVNTHLFDVFANIPPYTRTNSVGEEVDLYDILSEGDAVVLDFFASWCGPCATSTPALNAFFVDNGAGDENLRVLGMTVERADDNDGIINNLGWGATYDKFKYYPTKNDFFFDYFVNTFVPAADAGGIPTFILVCPNPESPTESTVTRTDVGFGTGMFANQWQPDFDACIASLPVEPTFSAAASSMASSVCVGSGTALSVVSEGATSFSWVPTEGLDDPSSATPNASPAATTTYTVTAMNANGDSAESMVTVEVNNPVVGVSTAGFDLSATAGFASYQWTLDGNAIDGATTANYSAVADGIYACEIADANGCAAVSESITVTGTGLAEIQEAGISIYPNPAASFFFVETSSAAAVAIFDVQGRLIKVESVTTGKTRLDASDLNAGIYLIEIQTEQGKFQSRLMIER